MATLTLENVPDELVARLEHEARENRRSLDQETVLRLERSLHKPRKDVKQTVASLRALHETMAHLPPIDDDLLDRARPGGRS